MEKFPKEQMYFLDYEKFLQNPIDVINSLAAFLGLDPLPEARGWVPYPISPYVIFGPQISYVA